MANKLINKEELAAKINALEGLDNETKSQLLELLRERKKYGIVWEEHPEDVEERLREELPILVEDKDKAIVSEDKDAPNHILIEGDNLEALTALSYTHEGRIDVIYIDPPYNTGNKDFVYNDAFVDTEDQYRHSKWLSFMAKRLKIAKRLLSDKGVIFISIDDNEQADIKLLCDDPLLFGERNFIAQMIWQQGKKSSGNLVGVNHEYILVYAKNRSIIDNPDFAWKQKKQGLDKIYACYDKLKKKYKDDYKTIEKELKEFFSFLPENDPAYANKHYCLVDKNGIFFADNSCAPDRPETRCHKQLIHPITGRLTAVPSLGWRWKEETLDRLVKEGRIYFGETEEIVPKVKKYLKEMETELPTSLFYKDGRGASLELDTILGERKFNNPKDRNEIARILNFRSNLTILDFFAGSGTTLHATMQLNAEDGGHRQCILVTNNENNICEEVTYERNKRVINGYTTPKGEAVEGLHNNTLRYYRTGFVGRENTLQNRRKLVYLATDMLCVKEDCYNEQPCVGKAAKAFMNGNKQLIIVYNPDYIPEVVEYIKQQSTTIPIKVYVFADGQYPYTDDFEEVTERVEICAIPSAILNAMRKVLPKKKTILLDDMVPDKAMQEDIDNALENTSINDYKSEEL